MKRQIFTAIGGILLLVFTAVAITNVRNTDHKLKLRDVQLSERGAELKQLELKYKNLNIELDKTEVTNYERIQQLEKDKQELDAEKQRLERELQAKLQRKEQERVAAIERQEKLVKAVTGTATASAAPAASKAVISGNKQSWLAASGIPSSEWWAVDMIVSRESSWNPNAVNPNGGACGLGQQLPCGKWAGQWNDPVAALKAQHGYVVARYGGYPQAVAFWNSHSWY